MDPVVRQRRVQELAEEIFDRKKELGHESPIPSFLNLFTEKMVEMEDRLDRAEMRADRAESALAALAGSGDFASEIQKIISGDSNSVIKITKTEGTVRG